MSVCESRGVGLSCGSNRREKAFFDIFVGETVWASCYYCSGHHPDAQYEETRSAQLLG